MPSDNKISTPTKSNALPSQIASNGAPTEEASGNDRQLCVICQTRARTLLLIPCSHFNVCVPCGHGARVCPTCGETIQGLFRVNV